MSNENTSKNDENIEKNETTAKKEKKLSIGHIIGNVAYVLRYALKINKKIVVMIILGHTICGLI
jgi:urocanate hydratase